MCRLLTLTMQDMHGSNSFKLSQRNCIYHITPLLAVDLGVSHEEEELFAEFLKGSELRVSSDPLRNSANSSSSRLSVSSCLCFQFFSKSYKPCSSHFWVDPSGVCFILATVSFRDWSSIRASKLRVRTNTPDLRSAKHGRGVGAWSSFARNSIWGQVEARHLWPRTLQLHQQYAEKHRSNQSQGQNPASPVGCYVMLRFTPSFWAKYLTMVLQSKGNVASYAVICCMICQPCE